MRVSVRSSCLFLVAVATLPACGGTTAERAGVPTTAVAPLTVLRDSPASRSGGTVPSYDPVTDTIAFSSYGMNFGLGRDTTPSLAMPGNFRAYGDPQDREAVRGTTDSGGGTVVAVRVLDGGVLRVHQRTRQTDLPTTGSATFAGTYAGVLANESQLYFSGGLIRGDVELNVDFGGATVDGQITGRIDSGGHAYGDVTLSRGILDLTDGTFEGTTNGGTPGSSRGPYTTTTGDYDGLIVGATGGEAVGGVTLRHRGTGALPLIEMGGFVAGD